MADPIKIVGTPITGKALQESYAGQIRAIARDKKWNLATIIPGFVKYRFESFATPRADVFELRKSVPDNSVLVILCNAGNPKQNQYAYIPCNNAGDLWITIQGKVTIDDIASEPSIATPDGFPETSDLRYNKQWFEDASRAIARKHGYIAGMVYPKERKFVWKQSQTGPIKVPILDGRLCCTTWFQTQDQKFLPVHISPPLVDSQSALYQIGSPGWWEPKVVVLGGGTLTQSDSFALETLCRGLDCKYVQIWMGAPWDIRGNNASGKPPNIIAENLNYLYLEKEVGFLREDIYYPSEAPEERNAEWPPGNPNPDAMDDGQKTMRLRKPTPLTIKFWPQGTWDSYKTLERKSYSNSRFYLVCLSPLPNSPETDWIQAAVPVDSRGEINTDNLEWIPLASDPFINFTVNYAGHVPYNIRITQIISAVGKSANMNYAFIREGYHTTTKYSDATIQAEKRVWTKDRDYRYGEDPLGGHITVYFMNTATNPSSFYPAHVYVDNDITFNYKSVVWFFPTPGDPEKFGGEF